MTSAAEAASLYDRKGGWRKAKWKNAWSTSFELGARASVKYNRVLVVSTPPEAILAEAQLQLWYRQDFALYALYSRSVSLGPAQMLGGGFRLPFIRGTLSLMVLAEVVSFQFDPPASVGAYPHTGTILRYGGAGILHLGAGIYLDGALTVTTINKNFFIAPMFGLGFQF